MFADYYLETYGIHTISIEEGFLTYKVKDNICTVYDIYITPAARLNHSAMKLAEMLQISALDKGAICLISHVSETQPNYKHSIDGQCKFGFMIKDVRLDDDGKKQYLLYKDLSALNNNIQDKEQ